MENKKNGFTLVELIVVVTILAILSMVGFISYSNYLSNARDSNRISQLKNIANALEVYRTKNRLPIAEDYIEISSGNQIIWYQWYLWKSVLHLLDYSQDGRDPLDNSYFTYYVTQNKRYYQLMAFLENQFTNAEILTHSVQAAQDYSQRYPVVYGSKLGIFTDKNNTPIQEVSALWYTLDIVDTQEELKTFLSNQNIVQGTGAILSSFSPNASCQRLYLLGNRENGIYSINPDGKGNIEVYCDMVTAWWGWTLIATTADDNNNSWTYDNRDLLWNNTTLWSLDNKYRDFKSPAYSSMKFKDMMFYDKQNIWWSYNNVNPGYDSAVSDWMPQTLDCAFWSNRDFSMTSWNVSKNVGVDDYQQDRMLFFSVYDNEAWCRPTASDNHNAYGPTWWYKSNQWFSPDDPWAMWWWISDNDSYWYDFYRNNEFWDARLGAKYARINGIDLWDETIETDDGDYILWYIR